MEKTLYCYRTCDVFTPQQKVGISNLLGWVGSRRRLTIYHKIPRVCTTRSAVISLGRSVIGLAAFILHAYRSYRWAYSHQTGYNCVGCTYSFYMPTGPTGGSTLIRLVTIGLAALILHAYRSYRWVYSHQTGYNWVGCTYSTCLQVLQVGLLSSDWLQLGWLHLFYMPTGPTGGLTLIRLVTIGLAALILHAYRSYRWTYSHQTGYNWVGCTYSTCLQVLHVDLLSSDWLQLGWLHLFCMPTGPTGGLILIRLVTIGLVALILHAYRSYRWVYSHQTGYNWVGCTYSTCLQVLQVGLLSSDWLQLGWLHLFYMPTGPTGGPTLIRLVTIVLVALIHSTCLQVLQVGLLSSDWLQLGWLHLFYMPTGPTGGSTLIRLVTIGLAALILHAYRSYRWAYSHQTGYNWVGCTYSTCLQVLQVDLLSSDWLQLCWLHLFILHAYRFYRWVYSHQTGYNWVGCTYSTCLQVLQVGLLSSDWLQLGWLHLFYMPTGPTSGLTLIRLVTIGLAALILHAYRSYRWAYSHQTGYNWVGCTYSTCLQVLQVDLLSSDWLQLGWLHLFYMPTGPTCGPTLIRLVTIGLAALILHAYRSYRWTYSHQTGYNWVGCTYSTCLQVLHVDLLSSDWLQLGWLHLFYMPTGPTCGPTLIRLVTIGLAALILHAYRSYMWVYSHQTGYNWVGCTYSTCLQVLHVDLLSSDWLQLGWLHLFYMPTGPTCGPTLIRLVTIGLAALILHAYRCYRWTYSHQTGCNQCQSLQLLIYHPHLPQLQHSRIHTHCCVE